MSRHRPAAAGTRAQKLLNEPIDLFSHAVSSQGLADLAAGGGEVDALLERDVGGWLALAWALEGPDAFQEAT